MDIKEMKEHFSCLYGQRNRIYLSGLRERIDYLNLAICDLQEAVRKEDDLWIIGIALARIGARIFCIAEHFWSLPLTEKMAQKYPAAHCSYCQRFPCVCPEKRPDAVLESGAEEQLTWSLKGWQNHLKHVYGKKNKKKGIENLLNRLFKETGELLALQMTIPNRTESSDKIERDFALELADTLAWTIAIANFFGMDLQGEILKRYKNNCWKCHCSPCICANFNVKPIKWETYR